MGTVTGQGPGVSYTSAALEPSTAGSWTCKHRVPSKVAQDAPRPRICHVSTPDLTLRGFVLFSRRVSLHRERLEPAAQGCVATPTCGLCREKPVLLLLHFRGPSRPIEGSWGVGTKGLQGWKPHGSGPRTNHPCPSTTLTSGTEQTEAQRGSATHPGSHSDMQPRQDLNPGLPGS